MRSVDFGVSLANQESPVIGGGGNAKGVFHHTHNGAVFPHPATFVFGLVEIVMMVSQNVMEQPEICGDARMKRVAEFQNSVQGRPLEGPGMLVMMIPGANTAFRNYRQQERLSTVK